MINFDVINIKTMGKEINKEWHAVEFAGTWMILDAPFYEGKDVVNADNVGDIRAEKNAKLMASAPILLEALIKMKEYYIHEKSINEWEFEEMIQLTEKAIKKATE